MHHEREQLKCLLYTTMWICVCVGVLAYNLCTKFMLIYVRESSWRAYCIYSNYYEYACVSCTAPSETLLSSYISPNLTSVCDFWRLLCRYTQNKKVVNVCVVLCMCACVCYVCTVKDLGKLRLDLAVLSKGELPFSTVCVYCLCMCAVCVCCVCTYMCIAH